MCQASTRPRPLARRPPSRVPRRRTANAGSPLMVRATDQLDARPLADITLLTRRSFLPTVNGSGFSRTRSSRRCRSQGGPPVTLGPVNGAALGASWGDDNTIVFATDDPGTGLWRVSADGGRPRPDEARRGAARGRPWIPIGVAGRPRRAVRDYGGGPGRQIAGGRRST